MMRDDLPWTPERLRIQILLEEVAILREETGRCESVRPTGVPTSISIGPVRCRKGRNHMGVHHAFGSGASGHADDQGRVTAAYWFQDWA